MSKLLLLPRNYRGKAYERVGLKIREFAGLSLEKPLDPFALAQFVKITVIGPSELSALPATVLAELIGRSQSRWSAVTLALPESQQLCILNPTHNPERTRATLMEEISHVMLGISRPESSLTFTASAVVNTTQRTNRRHTVSVLRRSYHMPRYFWA